MLIRRLHTIVGGTDGGTYYDDIPSDTSLSKIIRIEVSHSRMVWAFKVSWNTHDSPWRGVFIPERPKGVLTLSEGECITRVDGTTSGNWERRHMICSLRLHTSHGQIASFGELGPAQFAFTGGEGLEARVSSSMGLLSFETWLGRRAIFALRPTFAEYPLPEARATIIASENTKVKYESTPAGLRGSSFLRHLTSPLIALHVGSIDTMLTLHVAETTLCQLPFFNAALHGGFKESAEKAIYLPEDTPDVVSALVEFLSTGSYTYAYDSETVNEEAEGTFHLAVFVAAEKYGCEALATRARKGFRGVLSVVAGGAPTVRLRLWRRAYEAGLRAAGNWGTREDVVEFEKGMVKSVRVVLTECRVEFEEAVREVEGFGVDLMAIAVGISEPESFLHV